MKNAGKEVSVSRSAHVSHFASYIIGFVLSVGITLIAYIYVNQHVLSEHQAYSHASLMILLAALAVTQLVVQLLFFLRLGREKGPRWNLLIFMFAALVVVIIVGGSLWIMNNLNYHMMSPSEERTYMHNHEGL
jgi:cytochrome o ubiquinol oxidase operon protein cyoD